MDKLGFISWVLYATISTLAFGEITPYKYTESDESLPEYIVPNDSQFTIKEAGENAADITYYFSKPKTDGYPIAILCGGSSDKKSPTSIIHFHRYFLQELLDSGIAVLTVEQQGVLGNNIDIQEFTEHYTRSKHLHDHQIVIESIKANPPKSRNGKLIFIGVSEGGPIVTALTPENTDTTIATINWSGAGDWPWREELWEFIKNLKIVNPECPHGVTLKECNICSEHVMSRREYDAHMDFMLRNPSVSEDFLNMTYKYHADALHFSLPDYERIRTPFLVVTGGLDSLIESSDAFVEKAEDAGCPVTYMRIADMDHYVRKRPDIIQDSFDWLEYTIKQQENNQSAS